MNAAAPEPKANMGEPVPRYEARLKVTGEARFGSATHFGGKADEDVGLATRALAALNSNKVPAAIDLAERAVAKSPTDAGFRALLGNCYFAGGRFHSAEQAYRDALSLYPNQAQVILKLALVEIAQGRNNEAVAVLNQGRGVIDASDYGLALALAGRPSQAIAVLDPAAREQGADATVRQNLALAHALAGDWAEARTIAGQDVSPGQLDARMQQWMQLAAPKHPADQVAALLGVTPAPADAGQPVRLALNKAEAPAVQTAKAAPVAPKPASPPVVAAAAPAPAPVLAPAQAPVQVAAVAPAPPPPHSTIAALAETAVSEAKAVFAAVMPHSPAPAARPAKPRPIVASAVHTGKFPAVVQLGAYQSPNRVLAAWTGAAHKYGALKAYLPMSARFASPKGTFYRLSVRGFNNLGEANALCGSLRRQGGSCFVRNFAGDAPVQYASR